MSTRSLSWPALVATIVTCAVADGALLLLAWWATSDFLVAVFGISLIGGPITLYVAAPIYAWFKAMFAKRAAA